ncbi:MAG TPA: NrfD/PsrC family molybdoenzyme membrane anchor subunit [Dehalococcoidia bacterium]|nr:NrfD/PsrC family molybdoenzyme membrane anchor subunit [Dehalococcoidia bacterium]
MQIQLSQRASAPVDVKKLVVPVALVWAVAMVLGLGGVVVRFLTGHELANYTSSIPWGLWIASYVYFAGISAGAFLVSAVIYVFGIKRLEPAARLALFAALAALLAALVTIWLDLGHQWRFYRVFLYPNPSSMMAWIVWLYMAYLILIAVELWFVMRADLQLWAAEPTLRGRLAALLLGRPGDALSGRPRARAPLRDQSGADASIVRLLATLGIPLVIAISGGSGALFGVVGAREYWNAPLFPLMFIVGAAASGTGLVTAIAAVALPPSESGHPRDIVPTLGKVTLALLGVYLLIVWAEFSITLYADIPASTKPLSNIIGGPYAWVFWVFQIGLGSVIPLALLLSRPRSVAWVGLAAFLVAVGFFATRLNIVIPGLTEPQLEGLDDAFVEGRLSYSYFPSAMEWAVSFFSAALATGLFYAGYRLLPLVSPSKESSR